MQQMSQRSENSKNKLIANVLQIGDVVDFGTLNCQPCTKLELLTKLN